MSRDLGIRRPAPAANPVSSGKRRVGRPAGPARTALTVRVLTEIDEALTDAVEDTGWSPQYIADDALSEWLSQHGYLSNNQNR